MYTDAGYGENWGPEANNARRIDPYTRPSYILGCLFAVGLVLIIIVVLSLIPLYIAHNSSTTSTNNNNIQVAKVSVNAYTLQFGSPTDSFNPQTILSESNNRETLQAALTAMIQKDSTLAGSIIDIPVSSLTSKRTRRQAITLLNIIFDLNIIGSKSCTSTTCSNQFQAHAISQLSNINRTTSLVRYEESDTNDTTPSSSPSQIYWLQYKLPNNLESNVSFVTIDPKTISSLLDILLKVDNTLNQPSWNTSITSTPILTD